MIISSYPTGARKAIKFAEQKKLFKKENRGGKRPNSGRKKMDNPKKLKSFSVLESDYITFLEISKKYGLSNNVLFTLFLSEFGHLLKIKLDKPNK